MMWNALKLKASCCWLRCVYWFFQGGEIEVRVRDDLLVNCSLPSAHTARQVMRRVKMLPEVFFLLVLVGQALSSPTATLRTVGESGESAPTCPEKPCDPTVIEPVCGSDRLTYANRCELDQAGCLDPSISFASEGECVWNCILRHCDPDEYNPVCTNYGVTFNSSCLLSESNCYPPRRNIVSYGECENKRECDRQCGRTTKEVVCGSNRKTYFSLCAFQVDQCKYPTLTLRHRGPCRSYCPQYCPKVKEPVCGSDKKTYYNTCMLENARCFSMSLTRLYDGPCEE
nr:agrin-like isoform X1 [Procambarus clarkii]